MKALVLLSGGLDSTVCLAKAINSYRAENVLAVSFDYGQRHNKELDASEAVCAYYGVKHELVGMKGDFFGTTSAMLTGGADVPEGTYDEQGGIPATNVPFRNGVFLSVLAAKAMARGYDKVIIGIHQDDEHEAYPDCSIAFFSFMREAIAVGTVSKVEIVAPFLTQHKSDIVKDGLALKVPFELTWSCYDGGEKPCGKCATCIDRAKAFAANNAQDPLLLK